MPAILKKTFRVDVTHWTPEGLSRHNVRPWRRWPYHLMSFAGQTCPRDRSGSNGVENEGERFFPVVGHKLAYQEKGRYCCLVLQPREGGLINMFVTPSVEYMAMNKKITR